MSKTAFERYSSFIQEYIYRKGWSNLREVQIEACEIILDTDDHLIIASGTATGKTEAAFFPILTMLEKETVNSISVLYISPLKALINDQFERLNNLLKESDIPVWAWHGDVPQSVKLHALKERRGILQITPESLEAMLMNRSGEAKQLFPDLRFIIIDELHSFMGSDRGLQLLCLLSRLQNIIKFEPRRIALSATLNDYSSAMQYLSNGTQKTTRMAGIHNHKRTIGLCVECFSVPLDEKHADVVLTKYKEFLYLNCFNKKCLIFTNSRGESERIIQDMKKMANKRRERDVFFFFFGSVSKSLRGEVEKALRDNKGPTVTAATLTLELGIDIGDLDTTIQLGAPFSCSSFVQRLGRSGRRTEISQMMFVSLYRESIKPTIECMPWDLLRSIAVIQLYIEEKWVEPFSLKNKPFSLLVHQTLSILMSYGELHPPELARKVLSLPPFQTTISIDEYRELIRHMIATDYIEKMDAGGLILGLAGEKLTKHHSFYAVFEDHKAFTVFSNELEIGSLDYCPNIDDVFVLSGFSWKVLSVDETRKRINVKALHNEKIPKWSSPSGYVHAKIIERMKQVLAEDDVYEYLQPNARMILYQARVRARESGITTASIINNNGFYLFPWVGTKELNTIRALLDCGLKNDLEITSVRSGLHYLHIKSKLSLDEIMDKIKNLVVDYTDPHLVLHSDVILDNSHSLKIDKYDYIVPNNLLKKAFLLNEMDVMKSVEILMNIVKF
jgi:ATP-dependent Lhr-like helicase